eukprot:269411-Amphidinium_carterae.2
MTLRGFVVKCCTGRIRALCNVAGTRFTHWGLQAPAKYRCEELHPKPIRLKEIEDRSSPQT